MKFTTCAILETDVTVFFVDFWCIGNLFVIICLRVHQVKNICDLKIAVLIIPLLKTKLNEI